MMKKVFFILGALVALTAIAAVVGIRLMQPAPPASQAFVNGVVLTMDSQDSQHQAVLVKDDRIVLVGSTDEVVAAADKSTEIHDLQGKTMIPGIIDAHGHFPGTGLNVVAVDLAGEPVGRVTSIAQSIAMMAERAQDTPEGRWVIGLSYDDTAMQDNRHFTREDLDRVSTTHPVYALHVSGHFGVANSMALDLLGIDATTPDPRGGEIARNDDGLPTGLLIEEAHTQAAEVVYDFSIRQQYQIGRNATDHYLSRGITTAQNGLATKGILEGMSLFSKMGLVPLRLVVWPDESLAEQIVNGEIDPARYESEKFDVGAFKLVFDGSIQGFTGFLSDPYLSTPSGEHAGYRGHLRGSKEAFFEQVLTYHKAGHQIAIHANGDAAIDVAIEAFENALSKHPQTDTRPIVVHAQMASQSQLAEMKRLGMTPTFFSAHTYFWGDRHENIFLGTNRASTISPLRSATDQGLTYTIHLDSPVVPMEPMMMVWNATQRTTASGTVLGAQERITALQALRATTIDAAWQIHKEETLGSIEVGKLADFTILDQNPLTSETIRDIQVVKTIVGGVTLFEAPHE